MRESCELNLESFDHKLVAIVCADVCGYARLMAADEEKTIEVMTAYRSRITELIRRHRGRLVDFVGDNFLAEFPSALDAALGAVDIQRDLRERNSELERGQRVEFRMGIHLGDVRVDGEQIFGEGVNIAARLQALSPPGGICISSPVHEQIRHKLNVVYVDRGRHSVKHIKEPVYLYELRLDIDPQQAGRTVRPRRRIAAIGGILALLLMATLLAVTWPQPLLMMVRLTGGFDLPSAPTLPDAPSIVVLPFNNMSQDPTQDYFSDGITEDITTALLRHPQLFVISRNSAFTYKGMAVRVEDVGRELGVRYVLEGGVRKEGERVRVTAQLIDATTDFHVWAESYDRNVGDILTLQSEIAEQILVAVGIEIDEAEKERIRHKPTRSLSAYDSYMRAVYHFTRFTRKDVATARRFARRALALDDEFARAWVLLGWTYAQEFAHGWNLDPALLDRADMYARKALSLDPSLGVAHTLEAKILVDRRRHEEALVPARRAIGLDPNFAPNHIILAAALAQRGNFLAALQSINRAQRLDPRSLTGVSSTYAFVLYGAGRTREAVEAWEQVRAANADIILPRIVLAWIYELEGRHDEAATLTREVLRVNPNLTAESAFNLVPTGNSFSDSESARIKAALRTAGFPAAASQPN